MSESLLCTSIMSLCSKCCITELQLRGGAYMQCVVVSIAAAFNQHISAPPLTRTHWYSTLNAVSQSEYATNNIWFLHETATYSVHSTERTISPEKGNKNKVEYKTKINLFVQFSEADFTTCWPLCVSVILSMAWYVWWTATTVFLSTSGTPTSTPFWTLPGSCRRK